MRLYNLIQLSLEKQQPLCTCISGAVHTFLVAWKGRDPVSRETLLLMSLLDLCRREGREGGGSLLVAIPIPHSLGNQIILRWRVILKCLINGALSLSFIPVQILS